MYRDTDVVPAALQAEDWLASSVAIDEINLSRQCIITIVPRKTISLPETTYERLREERNEDESYGETVERLLGDTDLAEFWDAWSEETAEVARAVHANHRK